jgi:hypothetical protein
MSINIDCCEKVILVSLLKVRWHGLLSVLKQFITSEGHHGLVFLYHVQFLMHFIGFHLNVPFYLLRSLYKMSKRFKKQSLNSSPFHHGLIKMLLIHRLKSLGDDWDRFLTQNGFVTFISIETPISGQLVVNQFDFSNYEPKPLKENPRDEVVPNQFLNAQKNDGSELKETSVHELIVCSQATVKTDSTKPHKRSR